MRAIVVEALPSFTLRPFAKSLQILRTLIGKRVVFARHIEDLVGSEPFKICSSVSNSSGLKDASDRPCAERMAALVGRALILSTSDCECVGDMRIWVFAKADVRVADLHK